MKIALYYAMPGEIASLLEGRDNALLREVAGVKFYQIRENLLAVAGGVGKVNAAMSTQLLIDLYHPDFIIDVGVAGCFENLPIGTLMLPDRFVQYDVDTSAVGDPVGMVSTVNMIHFPVQYMKECRLALQNSGFSCKIGTGATGEWFATNSARAKEIAERFKPLFCEMEGGAIAQVCYRNQIPFIALKSVSDCLFGNSDYQFNFPTAMRDLNSAVLSLIDHLEICLSRDEASCVYPEQS